MHDVTVSSRRYEREYVCVCAQLISARRETAGWNHNPVSGEQNKQVRVPDSPVRHTRPPHSLCQLGMEKFKLEYNNKYWAGLSSAP